MHVGIGKRQSSQSIVVEDNVITTKRAAKLNLFDSVIWFPWERRIAAIRVLWSWGQCQPGKLSFQRAVTID